MLTPSDDIFLRRALRLAMNGRGHVEPNPMVGCVLVKNDQIIGEGWHQKFGQPHAEPNSLADCISRGNSPEGTTAYVTLEPCCHENKKTPPCAPRLIEARIARVVIGCLDPNPEVNGKGVATLRAAGIEVDVLPAQRGTGFQPVSSASAEEKSRVENPCHGLDSSHFQQLIAPFLAKRKCARDFYFTLKWAEGADQRVAGRNGARTRISNQQSNRLVHRLRSHSTAIVVGVNTVLVDDPELSVRGITVSRQPTRIILDRDLRIPNHAKLLQTNRDGLGGHVLILCSPTTYRDSIRVSELTKLGAQVAEMEEHSEGLTWSLEMSIGQRDEIDHNPHVLIEPGPTLARAALPVADRIWVFRAPQKVGGGPSAPKSAPIPSHYVATATLTLAGDTLTEYLNTNSPAFFAPVPSADFVLANDSVARGSGT